MPRFFVEQVVPQDQETLHLSGDDAHHLRRALRAVPGEIIWVCDGAGQDLRCELQGYEADHARLRILERQANDTEPDYQAVLYQGLPKGDKMDAIIRQCVELGVVRIVPILSDRCVAVPDSDALYRKAARWNRIAREAAMQCGRGIIPSVMPAMTFSESLASAAVSESLKMLAWEGEREQTMARVLALTAADEARPAGARATPKKVLAGRRLSFWVGPEGGFTEKEVADARAVGVQVITLGHRILRTETAGPAILAMLLYPSGCGSDIIEHL